MKKKENEKEDRREWTVLLIISKASNNVADVVTPAYLVNTVITSCRNQHQASVDLRLVSFFDYHKLFNPWPRMNNIPRPQCAREGPVNR